MIRNRKAAQAVVEHCQRISRFTERPAETTRTFLSAAMRYCLDYFLEWAGRLHMDVRVDAAGNFRAVRHGRTDKRLVIGSHLDTVPDAGAYDGVLGVVLGMAIVESYDIQEPDCIIEVVGFSEEEGVRYRRPFIGSLGFVAGLDDEHLNLQDATGRDVETAIRDFGLDVEAVRRPQMNLSDGFLEFHIEQGPVLESMNLPLGVVETIAGQTRATVEFLGQANHAGSTPMQLRKDAFCAAAEWTLAVERRATCDDGLVATVGRVEVTPGAGNVVPGRAVLSLDVRHRRDQIRHSAFQEMIAEGEQIAVRRRLTFSSQVQLQQEAVAMDAVLTDKASRAVRAAGVHVHRMVSGAGHDSMIVSRRIPSAMIFLRSPGGISHHPDERVLVGDVELALQAGRHFVEEFV